MPLFGTDSVLFVVAVALATATLVALCETLELAELLGVQVELLLLLLLLELELELLLDHFELDEVRDEEEGVQVFSCWFTCWRQVLEGR